MAWIFGLAALMLLDSDTVLNAVNGAAGVFVLQRHARAVSHDGLKRPVRPAERTGEALDDGGLLLAGGFAASAQRLEGLWERGELPERRFCP